MFRQQYAPYHVNHARRSRECRFSSWIHCLHTQQQYAVLPHLTTGRHPASSATPDPRCFCFQLPLLHVSSLYRIPRRTCVYAPLPNTASNSFTGNNIAHLALRRWLHLPIPVDPRTRAFCLRPKTRHTTGAEGLPGICPRRPSGSLIGIHRRVRKQ